LGDDALHALAALIADRAGDRIAVDDFCGHGRLKVNEIRLPAMPFPLVRQKPHRRRWHVISRI